MQFSPNYLITMTAHIAYSGGCLHDGLCHIKHSLDSDAFGGEDGGLRDVEFQTSICKLEQAKARAKTANKVALEAEKEKDAAEKAWKKSAEQVIRPPGPPDVSVCKGIMSCFSFLFLGVPRHYAKRPFSCWCKACSRV